MKKNIWMTLLSCAVMGGLVSCHPEKPSEPPAPKEGIALAIVYDTSGSMEQDVLNSSGAREAKYLIARRVMNTILGQLEAYTMAAQPEAPRTLYVELISLEGSQAKTAVPLKPLDVQRLKKWIHAFSKPRGGTPLGQALRRAAEDLARSGLSHQHILVVTDGENTEGPKPESVMPAILEQARKNQKDLQIHFVAFDVAADVFQPVRDLGATVAGAENEAELSEKMNFILKEKILLENEEPALIK